MRIFITGIAGFLGSNLSHKLIEEGHDVFGIDNLVGGDERNVHPKCVAWTWDVTDAHCVRHALEIAQPDVIIHTACYPHEGLSVFSPIQVCDSVSRGTNTILAVGIDLKNQGKIPLRRFINMSSMARYGNPIAHPNAVLADGMFAEWMQPKPRDPYGAHKYAAELTVSLMGDVHGLEWVNLIPHNIYGPRQKFEDPHRNVAAIMIHRCLRGEPIVVYGDGEQVRCFSYIDDILPAIVQCLDSPKVCGQTINIGPDQGEITINELASIVQKLHFARTSKLVEIVHTADRPNEVKHATCSAAKLREMFGEQKETPIWMGISMLYDWIVKEGPREWDYDAHELEITSPLTPITWLGKL